MIKKRYLQSYIESICFPLHKMAFIAGPRQAGKTVLSKQLLKARGVGAYYNWDALAFRKQWAQDPSSIIPHEKSAKTPIIILDEIHKAKKWKQNLKGVFDTLERECDLIVTGSTKLNAYRKGSDSLMGRYFYFRLHPFSLAELATRRKGIILPEALWGHCINDTGAVSDKVKATFKLLDTFGPFPEPLLAANKAHLNLWQRGRIEKIVREDIRDLSRTLELSQIEMLVSLLPDRVANPLSLQSLAEDLEVAYTTVKRWITYLYELYYCYVLKPYAKSTSRSIKKEGKLYLWDWSEIKNEGVRFENLIAGHLLKYCQFLTDTGEGLYELRYWRNRQRKEIDFMITKDGEPCLPIEVKLSDQQPSANWPILLKQIPIKHGIQIVKKSGVYKLVKIGGYEVLVISADRFLGCLV
ncbi:MAG: ATP-binding protein [Coxiellaceae bacterium]|nr:ATP-binding protein [Coxiellaceae bacterium]